MKLRIKIVVLILCLYTSGVKAAPVYHPIDQSKWERTVEGLSYSEKKEEIKEKENEQRSTSSQRVPLTANSSILQIIGFTIIAALLIFILLKLFGKGLFSNKKVETSQASIIKQLEEDPMESDLDRFLREALEMRDYKLAVRVYYLMLLRGLHDKNFIAWKKNKTNMDYLSEVSKHPSYMELSNTTLIYEFIWYGEKSIEEAQFNTLSVSFISLIKQINNSR